MYVQACTVMLRLNTRSLKEKRAVLKSLLAQLKQRFNLAVAEVGRQDSWQFARLGFAVVSGLASHAVEQREKVLHFLEEDLRFDVVEVEVLP